MSHFDYIYSKALEQRGSPRDPSAALAAAWRGLARQIARLRGSAHAGRMTECLDERSTAERTTLSVRMLQQLRRDGGGPPFAKVGRRVIYRWADVEAWLAARVSA